MKVIYFSASWCGPCKMFKPILQQVSSELGTFVNYVDVDQNPEKVSQYNVSSVPTLVIEDQGGKQLFRHTGAMGSQQLVEVLSRFK